MDTYTIAEAARLVGTSRSKLYQAIRTGQLQTAPGGEADQAMTVTRAALRAAGFAVLPAAAPSPLPAPEPAPALVPATPAPPAPAAAATPAPAPIEAPAVPALPPERSWPDQALIVHLERALEQAQERERRLLDLLAYLTGQHSAPPVAMAAEAPPPAVPPAAASRPAAPPPLSGLHAQIVAVLQQHPEGLSPKVVRTLLQVDQDVRSTMKGMVRSGLLTRLAAGRYVVAVGR
jgi:hypothetical protein